ncbi:hypothetical protein ACQUW5_06220 [Legionella sp. CNM-1927-20]|uniref:hypothetical protein n=1 Tax=Legionella sp. CNM-1927-20 TaxID=3422221 RepID=UPI00403B354F
MKNEGQLKYLVENALDFLQRAFEDINGDPKYAYIHFWSGVELFLKARIIMEHWSLIIKGQPNLEKYLIGDFCSKNFDEMCDVLEKVISAPIDKDHKQILNDIKNQRNKWVHFSNNLSERDNAKLISDQMHGWYILNLYLNKKWHLNFYNFTSKIKTVYEQIEKKYQPYQELVYKEYIKNELVNLLKKDKFNTRLFRCSNCSFCSSTRPRYQDKLIYESSCKLCGYESINLFYTCEKCQSVNQFSELHCACKKCNEKYSWIKLILKIKVYKLEEHSDVHCYCGSNKLIEYDNQFFCFECRKAFTEDDINECSFCQSLGPENMEDGCYHCLHYEPDWELLYPRN